MEIARKVKELEGRLLAKEKEMTEAVKTLKESAELSSN